MDTVPAWVVIAALSALGALIMFLLSLLRDHINEDGHIHTKVEVNESKLNKIEEKEIPKIQEQIAFHDERLHSHGREIQQLIAKEIMRDRNK